uniref:hypothetical protein n=1 Tax=Streptomyces lunaelactis TaxID=1535768 RepID=UPI0020C7769C
MLFLVPADAAAELIEVLLDDGVGSAAGLQLRDGVPVCGQRPQVVGPSAVQLLGAGAGESQGLPEPLPPGFGVISALLVPHDLLQQRPHPQHQRHPVLIRAGQELCCGAGLDSCRLDLRGRDPGRGLQDEPILVHRGGEQLLRRDRVSQVQVGGLLFHEPAAQGWVFQVVDRLLQPVGRSPGLAGGGEVEGLAGGDGLGPDDAGAVVADLRQRPAAALQPLRMAAQAGFQSRTDGFQAVAVDLLGDVPARVSVPIHSRAENTEVVSWKPSLKSNSSACLRWSIPQLGDRATPQTRPGQRARNRGAGECPREGTGDCAQSGIPREGAPSQDRTRDDGRLAHQDPRTAHSGVAG